MASTPKIKRAPRLAIEVLDRTRPYGEVYGEHADQVKYTQPARKVQDWPYDAHEILVERALTPKQRDMLAAMRKQAEEKAKAEPAPAEEDEVETEASADGEGADELEPDAPGVKDDDGINLVLWLKGELKAKPTEVQKVLKARFGVNKPERTQQALYLVEEQRILPRDQVHKSILPPAAV